MANIIVKTVVFLMAFATVVGLALGAYWLLWLLWCWVLPQVWATGPQGVIAPSFWLFAGAWFLLSLLGKAIFGRADKD